jgi:hypothetical protein
LKKVHAVKKTQQKYFLCGVEFLTQFHKQMMFMLSFQVFAFT